MLPLVFSYGLNNNKNLFFLRAPFSLFSAASKWDRLPTKEKLTILPDYTIAKFMNEGIEVPALILEREPSSFPNANVIIKVYYLKNVEEEKKEKSR